MKLHFYKYQGAGNDFVMIDDRQNDFPYNTNIIKFLCNRRFGIGADGLITLKKSDNLYGMRYFNSDGNESTMCGNGGRCFARFLQDLGLAKGNSVEFDAIDGLHSAEFIEDNIKLQMINVETINKEKDYTFLNTGSPHHVVFVENTAEIDVKNEGAKIRYSELYPEGSNVNFVEILNDNKIKVRTYERGVEDETLSCGTGVTACSITLNALGKTSENKVFIETLGGNLIVEFDENNGIYTNIFLTGPAQKTFEGEIEIK